MKAKVTNRFDHEHPTTGVLETIHLDTDKGRFILSAKATVRAVLTNGNNI